MEKDNLLPLIVPSALTVIGWIFTALWAVKQVNIAHKKNRNLQHEILRQSIKDNLSKEFINLYLDIAKSIIDLRSMLGFVSLNMDLDEQMTNKQITFGWRESFEKINHAYSTLCKNIDHLEIWLDVSSKYIPNSNEIYTVINEFKVNFIAPSARTWFPFQKTLAVIQVRNQPDVKEYRKTGEPVNQSLNSILSNLKENAKIVQKHLVSRGYNTTDEERKIIEGVINES